MLFYVILETCQTRTREMIDCLGLTAIGLEKVRIARDVNLRASDILDAGYVEPVYKRLLTTLTMIGKD